MFYNNTTWGLIRTYLKYRFLHGKRSKYLVIPTGFACNDSESTLWKEKAKEIRYEKPDGVVSFRKEESWERSGTVITPGDKPLVEITDLKTSTKSIRDYGGLETRLCPTGVFSLSSNGALKVNQERCILCKACEVKVPGEYIQVHNPEGGEGPH